MSSSITATHTFNFRTTATSTPHSSSSASATGSTSSPAQQPSPAPSTPESTTGSLRHSTPLPPHLMNSPSSINSQQPSDPLNLLVAAAEAQSSSSAPAISSPAPAPQNGPSSQGPLRVEEISPLLAGVTPQLRAARETGDLDGLIPRMFVLMSNLTHRELQAFALKVYFENMNAEGQLQDAQEEIRALQLQLAQSQAANQFLAQQVGVMTQHVASQGAAIASLNKQP